MNHFYRKALYINCIEPAVFWVFLSLWSVFPFM